MGTMAQQVLMGSFVFQSATLQIFKELDCTCTLPTPPQVPLMLSRSRRLIGMNHRLPGTICPQSIQVAKIQSAKLNTWVDVDVTRVAKANKTISLAFVAGTNDGFAFSSRNATTTTNHPSVLISTGGTHAIATQDSFLTYGSSGAQGAEYRDGLVYIFSDSTTGVIREYNLVGDSSLSATGRSVALTLNGVDKISHPTGLTYHSTYGTFLGNTVNQVGTIYLLDWAALWNAKTLDGAILHSTVDDLAVNGTRPEFVRIGTTWYLATSDYGSSGNLVRLYDPSKVATVSKTSEPGTLVASFPVGPYVQSLHWVDEKGLLFLVQNTSYGAGWKMTSIDLAASVEAGQQKIVQTFTFPQTSELEGFHMISATRGIAVTSTSTKNTDFITFGWY